MDRYIGFDAHASSCSIAVHGPNGRELQFQVLERNAKALINFLETINNNRKQAEEEMLIEARKHPVFKAIGSR
ncbi:MAG: hypothetical protein GY780_00900 [bacterium]|nr:hypothetical protein [bacterium]